MSIYYLSACHDCKQRIMWSKVSEELAEKWHGRFHKGHNTVFANDFDDDFHDSIREYKDLGIQDGLSDESLEKLQKIQCLQKPYTLNILNRGNCCEK